MMLSEFDQDIRSLISKVDEKVCEWEKKSIGLEPVSKISSAPRWLAMSIDEIIKKSPEELSEACFVLAQYSIHVQRIINYNHSWIRWCNSKLDEEAAREIQNIPAGYGWNEMSNMARQLSELCRKINKFKRQLQLQNDRLYDLPRHIQAISDTIKDIKFMQLKREKEYNNATE